MAINPALLIAAPMLQDVLIDNVTGLPMSDGVVTMYQDNSRTTLKNWYYQSGSPGAYTYITLPNPMTLSGIGTIQDGNGNDTIPFFYPYDETTDPSNPTPQPYYVTVVDSNGQAQFTRQNFPFLATAAGGETNVTLKNHIVNNVFWRNSGPAAITLTNTLNITLAPSAHDGQTYPDWQFFKNASGAIDTATFSKFAAGTFLDSNEPEDVTPEFYLNLTCSGAGTETQKYIQVPITLHQITLESVPVTITLWSRCNSAATNANNITIGIYQFNGTGVTSPIVIPSTTVTLPVNSSWVKTVVSLTMPSAVGATLSTAGDDAFYLQIGYPVATTFNIDIAKACLYIGQTVPSNEVTLYDEADSVILLPRTGDIRTSLNQFQPFGWVTMNDGTIGNASSNATARANTDIWQLFSLIWSLFKAYDTGSNSNPICQMYTSAGAATNYGTTAYGDFTANNALALTKMMGKILMGTVPQAQLLAATATITGYKSGVTFTNSSGNLLVNTVSSNLLGVWKGAVVTFAAGTAGTLPTGITANTLYYAVPVTSTTFLVSPTFADALSAIYVAYTNTGTAPNNCFCFPAGSFEGEYAHTQLEAELAAHSHPGSVITGVIQNYSAGGGNSTYNTTGSPTSANVVIATDGSSTPFNVVQPSTFMNFYIKL